MTTNAHPHNVNVPLGLTFATTMFPRTTKGVLGNVYGVHFLQSPYYYWFKFLQLNEEYDRALKGEKTKISQEVVKDFGNVRDFEFEEWWDSHAHLFAEPRSQIELKVANDANELAPFNSHKAVNVVVPLDWRNQDLRDAIGLLIDRLVPKRPVAMKLSDSQAKYRLGRKWNMKALHEAFVVMKYKNIADVDQLATGKKKLAWADLGIKVRHSYAQREKMKIGNTKDVDRRITLTILTTRAYKRAQVFLAASVTNSFPT
jgi:hypothetical protein